jgi:hypothetical protein
MIMSAAGLSVPGAWFLNPKTAALAELDFAALVLNLGKFLRLDPARRSAAMPA